ncbi:MAG: hypothetical protein QG567_1218 [Campylobacterota bacterium]|nr:hypothetical protein [Campylobacterota bacterium]
MAKKIILLLLFLTFVFADSIEMNTNNVNYELIANKHNKFDKFSNLISSVGYLKSEDEFKNNQEMLYLQTLALNTKPIDRWTFAAGIKLFKASIENTNVIGIPLKIKAFYHIPLKRKVYLALSYLHAPSFLVFSDEILKYDEIELDMNLAIKKDILLYLGARNIKFTRDAKTDYEFSNAGHVGVRYFF